MSNQENNKMIAEFMGLELEETLEGLFVYARKEQSPIKLNDIRTEFYEVHELQYHISWDWLMPVVNKIRNVTSYDRDRFSTEVIIYGNKTTIKSGGYGEKKHSNLFFNKTVRGANNTTEATYYAVVEFIKWYNKNQ